MHENDRSAAGYLPQTEFAASPINSLLSRMPGCLGGSAKLARDKQRCPRRSLAPRGVASRQPSRRDAACHAGRLGGCLFHPPSAQALHADVREIRLGARATERDVKALSASGKLAQYRIVHFATHGALSGQADGNAEPGLLMTPPDVASEEDDCE